MKNTIKQAISIGKEISHTFHELKKKSKKKLIERNAKIEAALKKEQRKEDNLPSIAKDRLGKHGIKL